MYVVLPPQFVRPRRTPKSNAERQREFRKRNPGYYQRLHARRRAAVHGGASLQLQQHLSKTEVDAPLPAASPE